MIALGPPTVLWIAAGMQFVGATVGTLLLRDRR